LRIFFETTADAVKKGERPELYSFYMKKYRGYTGRKLKTGEQVKITEKKLPFFKCGKELRNKADSGIRQRKYFLPVIQILADICY